MHRSVYAIAVFETLGVPRRTVPVNTRQTFFSLPPYLSATRTHRKIAGLSKRGVAERLDPRERTFLRFENHPSPRATISSSRVRDESRRGRG